MKKLTSRTITTYDFGNIMEDLLIDVVYNGEEYEAWIYFKDYGIKEMMFGMMKKDFKSIDAFLGIVTKCLVEDDYIEGYVNEYAPELQDKLEEFQQFFQEEEF